MSTLKVFVENEGYLALLKELAGTEVLTADAKKVVNKIIAHAGDEFLTIKENKIYKNEVEKFIQEISGDIVCGCGEQITTETYIPYKIAQSCIHKT